MASARRTVRWPRIPATAALLVLGLAQGVYAHGQPLQLAFWGGFRSDLARCQRALARAAGRCVGDAIAARQACLGPQLAGEACDEGALTASITAIRQRALDSVDPYCTDQQLRDLVYNDRADALTDIIDVCRQLDTSSTTAVFGPAMVGGSVGAVTESKRPCLDTTGHSVARLMRFAMRARQRVLDQIAAVKTEDPSNGEGLNFAEKQALIERARQRIAKMQAALQRRIDASCPQFDAMYGMSTERFLADVAAQADCLAGAVYVQDTVVCPTSECGNGIQEKGEECDDANDFDGDGCRGDCVRTECEVFANSFDLIQQAIFENHGCTSDACHGSGRSGGLDLRDGLSYEHLVDVPSQVDPKRKRVEPGDPQLSVLFLKLATKTLPDRYREDLLGVGAPMPSGLPALSEDELEALRLWIYGAASRTESFPGIGERLDACLPEPEPIAIKPLDPLAPGEGVQLHMPQWIVDAQSEHEVCFASYFDVTDQVPEDMRGPNNTFCYNTDQLRQDPLSHHLIVNLYTGRVAPNDPQWGPFLCRGGAQDGAPCDPVHPEACGPGSGCATTPVIGVGCNIPASEAGRTAVPFAGAQETNASSEFPDGVYRCIPMKGMILWNSHAFNLTNLDGKLEAWLNFRFAKANERRHFANGIFNTSQIFKMVVPAFQSQEVCNIHQLPPESNLFEITSHTHRRGKRFRIFRGAFTCQGQTDARGGVIACDPLSPTQCSPGVTCGDPTGSDPDARLLYVNFTYNDPLQLRFDPPLLLSGTAADRSLTYCSLYDNGATDPSEVKRQSSSPITPFGTSTCSVPTHCVGGKEREPCSGATPEERNASCDSESGSGDGLCDACTLRGGVTTEDEMFVLIGSYFQ